MKKAIMPKIGKNRRVIGRPFTKGGPGTGRRKGQLNRFTTLKAAFISVFERLGGEDALLAWVELNNDNQKAFYGWVARMLPTPAMSAPADDDVAIQTQLARIADAMMQ